MFNDNGSFLLALFEFFLFFAWFMCLFWIFGDIFRSKDLGGVAKTLWVLFVIFIPWLGILVYLIARGQGMQERQLEQAIQMQRAQTEYIKSVAGTPRRVPRIRSHRRRACSTAARSPRRSSTSSRRRPSPPERRPPPNSTVRYPRRPETIEKPPIRSRPRAGPGSWPTIPGRYLGDTC